jgi:hypothetical protein
MKQTLILLAVLLCGCVPERTVTDVSNEVNIRVIDGCEYIRTHVYSGYTLTHKGNCTNHVVETQRKGEWK